MSEHPPNAKGVTTDLRGILNLNKPVGITSRDAVNVVSRLLRKIKVGHAGTLDPLASGVLVVCVGAATRLIEYVQQMPKTYTATIRLGATSDTLDADGTIVETATPRVPTEKEIRDALATQLGTIQQLPPQFSALKVGGARAYDLARAGKQVELEARPVEIHRIELRNYAWPRLEIEVDCGSGTYIRSIARDLGETLSCGGLIEVLTRTRIGPFALEDASDLATISRESLPTFLHPVTTAVAELPRVVLSESELKRIALGQAVTTTDSISNGEIALIGPTGELAAIAEAEPSTSRLLPKKVFVASQEFPSPPN